MDVLIEEPTELLVIGGAATMATKFSDRDRLMDIAPSVKYRVVDVGG
jgi:hypothetical protein